MGSINLVVGGTAGLVLDLIINEPNVLASELGVLVGCGDGVWYGKAPSMGGLRFVCCNSSVYMTG